jgi:hypothetical protein
MTVAELRKALEHFGPGREIACEYDGSVQRITSVTLEGEIVVIRYDEQWHETLDNQWERPCRKKLS